MPDSWLRFFVMVGAAYVGLRLAAYLPASIGVWPDSGTYIKTAHEPLLSEEFLAGWRSLTVPLLYKVMPDSDSWRAVGQLVVSVASWLSLAAAVAWNVRPPGLRKVAFALVLLFSLSVWITQWDSVILSESLTLSMGAAALAAWLALVRSPSLWTVAAVLVATFFLVFARDSEAPMALMAAPFALAWTVLGDRRREGVVLTVGLLAITAAVWAAQSGDSSGPRREGPILNVVSKRVLPSHDQRRWFIDHGMPVTDQIDAFAGEGLAGGDSPVSPGKPLREEPDVAAFLQWVRDEGRQTLIGYHVAHPYRALRPVVVDADLLLETEGDSPLSTFRPEGADPLLPRPLAGLAYPEPAVAVAVWLALAALAAAWLVRLGLGRPSWLVPAGALLLQIPHAALIWHAEPYNITRHAVSVSMLTRLSLLILTIFLVEAVLELRRGTTRATARA